MSARQLTRVVAALSFCALPVTAHAFVPDPSTSTCGCLVVSPSGAFPFRVELRDAAYNPVQGFVELSFVNTPDIIFCSISPGNGGYFYDAAGPNGRVEFVIYGGGTDAHNARVTVYYGELQSATLCTPRPRSTDLNGDLVVDAEDVAIHASLPSNSLAGDYNCDGVSDATDRAFIIGQQGTVCAATDAGPRPRTGSLLAQSIPNPARGELTIAFVLRQPGPATLRVRDLAGRTLRTLFNGGADAGPHLVPWDRKTDDGATVPPGTYFYELRARDLRAARRMVLLR